MDALRRREASPGGSRREPADRPAAAFACPDEAVVQPRRTPLPELDTLGRDADTAPVRWTWNALRREARLGFREARLERSAVGDRCALRRRPGSELRRPRTLAEVVVGLLRADALGAPFDANLPLELRPEEDQRDARVRADVATLAAVVVRMEDEAPRVDGLQQHDPRSGLPVGIDGRERHRIGFRDLRRDRL